MTPTKLIAWIVLWVIRLLLGAFIAFLIVIGWPASGIGIAFIFTIIAGVWAYLWAREKVKE